MTHPKVSNTSGKRKTAIARAVIRSGSGRVRINQKPVELYEPVSARAKILEALQLAPDLAGRVDIDVSVAGGGVIGQAAAARTAIARGLVEFSSDEELKARYLAYDRTLLVNDPRRKEAKHQLGRGARKKRQKSYR